MMLAVGLLCWLWTRDRLCDILVQKADIWSCGVILYAMLYGCYPFSNKEPDYIRKIVTASYHIPPDIQVHHGTLWCCRDMLVAWWAMTRDVRNPLGRWLQVSDECKDLLMRLLVANAEQRMPMEEIKLHPWFLHGLPSGALAMNEWYLKEQNGMQEVIRSSAAVHAPMMHLCSLLPFRQA